MDVGRRGIYSEADAEIEPPIRVLVASSVGLLADAICALLQTDPGIELVGTIDLQALAHGVDPLWEPDVVIVECLFASESCPELLERVRDTFPSARVLVVSRELDDDDLAELVVAGALGCLSLDCRRDELMRAIRRVSAGEILYPAALLMRLLTRQHEPHRGQAGTAPGRDAWNDPANLAAVDRASTAEPSVSLAPRERQVLETLAQGRSTEEVAEALGITIHTVRTHLKNIMVKLNAHSKLEAVVVALRRGLIELHD